jgi:hypothetical protein
MTGWAPGSGSRTWKRGLIDNGDFITGRGLTLTYSHRHLFFRVAHDPYANFSGATQNRFSLGVTY